MPKDRLIRWWCLECDDKFYVTKIKSDKAFNEGRKFHCVHCGSNEYTVLDEF